MQIRDIKYKRPVTKGEGDDLGRLKIVSRLALRICIFKTLELCFIVINQLILIEVFYKAFVIKMLPS